ncbi:MAG: NAD-dependent epimerase/dehydratase family protein [Candidatus Chisholmbacteria bacterium]|nr:NAD-dependent epimerase/dehydratase family protein [Candidatus Chisholmbacteria bacterium]
MKKHSPQALVTGSGGLIGSEAVEFFVRKGFKVVGIDNDMRRYFFGQTGSTAWNTQRLKSAYPKDFTHITADIRDEKTISRIFSDHSFDLVIHAAAQPSHDWAAKEPLTDFSINATGTLIMLENLRRYTPDAVFIFTSTNKVYGDRPNTLPLKEYPTRWDVPKTHPSFAGIDESMSIDATLHSVFGASKVAADVMVQEYGRYFGLKTVAFRGGCLTGPHHSAASLHGFLAYLVKAIQKNITYNIRGFKGKQVRDNIHAHDLIASFYEVFKKPRSGEVYNIGGSRFANVSILEAIAKIEAILGKKAKTEYFDQPRIGDHQWYISDISKFKRHYPKWQLTYGIDQTLKEICRFATKGK